MSQTKVVLHQPELIAFGKCQRWSWWHIEPHFQSTSLWTEHFKTHKTKYRRNMNRIWYIIAFSLIERSALRIHYLMRCANFNLMMTIRRVYKSSVTLIRFRRKVLLYQLMALSLSNLSLILSPDTIYTRGCNVKT